MMHIAVTNYAKQLFDQYGAGAAVIAAKRRRAMESSGEPEKALVWRRIQRAIAQMRGPSET
jgi:hypothetical protein